jgi:capsular exopolysaccharide synthesis family protein
MPAEQPTARLLNVPQSDDLGFGELLAAIRRRIWVMVGTVVCALAIAYAYTELATPRYQSEAMLLIENQNPNIMSVESVVRGVATDIETIRSESLVLGARILAERVIEKLDLERDPEFYAEEDDHSGSGVSAAHKASMVIQKFQDRLNIVPVDDSRVISVSFSSTDPVKAAAIANLLVDEYILAQIEAKFESTQRVGSWLSQRIGELRDTVRQSENAVEQARQAFGLLESNGGTLAQQELAELNTQLITARAERTATQARLRQVQSLISTPDGLDSAIEVLDSPIIQRLREQQTDLDKQLAELSTEFGGRHPRMVQLEAEAQDLQLSIDTEVLKIVQVIRNRLEVDRAKVRSLETSLDSLKQLAGEANRNEIQVRALEREAEASRQLLATLLARQKETVSQEDARFQQADARIISRAAVPLEPAFPRPGLILGLAGFAATFLGLLLVFAFELADNGFRSGEQAEQFTGLQSLGIIPRAPKRLGTPIDLMLDQPRCAFSEAIRTLHWTVTLAFPDNTPKTILVASANPSEGKSTTATCMAIAQARSGARTMLIDADTRWPSVHTLLGMDPGRGLIEFLRGDAKLEEIVGGAIPNPAALLASERMHSLLQECGKAYDTVIIDAPPVLACADTRILAKQADATVMAIHWAKTRRNTANLAARQLETAGARMAGVVLTLVDLKRHAMYSYGDSGSYSGDFAKYYGG